MALQEKLLPEKEVSGVKSPRPAETSPGETGVEKKEATHDGKTDKASAALCPEPYHVAKTLTDSHHVRMEATMPCPRHTTNRESLLIRRQIRNGRFRIPAGTFGERASYCEQEHPKRAFRIASQPSRTMSGVRIKEASGSAHDFPQMAFTPRPARAIHAM